MIISSYFSLGQKSEHPSKHFNIQLLKPGIWAVINNDKTGYAICNAGIIDLGDKTIVFDAFISPLAAADLKKEAEQLTHRPVTFLVNSHFHDDHIRGNQVFVPGTHIISTAETRNAILSTEPQEQEDARSYVPGAIVKTKEQLKTASEKDKPELQMWLSYFSAIDQSIPSLKITPPDIVFSDSLLIYGSSRNAKLIECKNGHTTSDVILVLPKDSIAFMGDILFAERHPWLGDGDPISWLQHLKTHEQDSTIKIFVPGHGPVTDKNGVRAMMHYIQDVQQIVQDGISKNLADSVITKEPVPEAYASWWFGRFYRSNLSFLCSKMRK